MTEPTEWVLAMIGYRSGGGGPREARVNLVDAHRCTVLASLDRDEALALARELRLRADQLVGEQELERDWWAREHPTDAGPGGESCQSPCRT